jgi:hypothetical protein
MMDPSALLHLANATLALLAPHTPWLLDKVGGATVTQAVRETWDLMKHKLSSTPEGQQALARAESESSPEAAVESLKPALVAALQSDKDFAEQLSRLVITGSDNQVAAGNNVKQAKVTGSSDVSINIS